MQKIDENTMNIQQQMTNEVLIIITLTHDLSTRRYLSIFVPIFENGILPLNAQCFAVIWAIFCVVTVC